jgi:hypothetical protein
MFIQNFFFTSNRRRRIGGVATASHSPKTAETRITFTFIIAMCFVFESNR